MATNATTTEDIFLIIISDEGNAAEDQPTDDEPAIGDLPVGEPSVGDPATGEPAVDESDVDESDVEEDEDEESGLDQSDIEESGLDQSDAVESGLGQSDIEESGLDQSDIEESSHDNAYEFAINKHHDVEEATADEYHVEELKNVTNYIDKCNSDQNFIVKMHTKSIYDITPLPEKPSALQLGQFTDKLVLHVWVLQMLDQQDVDLWSDLLVHLISNKLDRVTRNLWNTFIWNYKTTEHGQKVCISLLLEFLRATCHEYEVREPSRSFRCVTLICNNLSHRC